MKLSGWHRSLVGAGIAAATAMLLFPPWVRVIEIRALGCVGRDERRVYQFLLTPPTTEKRPDDPVPLTSRDSPGHRFPEIREVYLDLPRLLVQCVSVAGVLFIVALVAAPFRFIVGKVDSGYRKHLEAARRRAEEKRMDAERRRREKEAEREAEAARRRSEEADCRRRAEEAQRRRVPLCLVLGGLVLMAVLLFPPWGNARFPTERVWAPLWSPPALVWSDSFIRWADAEVLMLPAMEAIQNGRSDTGTNQDAFDLFLFGGEAGIISMKAWRDGAAPERQNDLERLFVHSGNRASAFTTWVGFQRPPDRMIYRPRRHPQFPGLDRWEIDAAVLGVEVLAVVAATAIAAVAVRPRKPRVEARP